ncbi:glycosyltransferase family 4 protein [Phytohabitans sp. ZYX-F-186]|uniref:Glycosyltransferase family 4 protein n=1 Tax=Phytohabitans maris TaxID=3071409 RepID=A0ABU0ZAP2_9ACTN|nr:glycosyltransferase family 4 protein [Phytohabitans sp. ZYX-F-186]MDQ7904125.1 glycosyltransferase family 4 protein [Phytohabitans sp. ZYX-F-186]
MAGRPRILLYTSVDAVGGAEVALGNLVGGLGGAYDVHVAGTDEPVVRWVAGHRPGVPYHVTGGGPLAHARLLRRVRPDLVQANLEVPWAAPTMLGTALALRGPRVVAVQHMAARTVDLPLLLRTRALALRLDANVAVSADGARRVENFYALGRDSVHVIHNGVPVPGQPVASGGHVPGRPIARGGRVPGPGTPVGRAAGEIVVGCVGRLDAVKGQDVLIDALPRLPGVRVRLVGSGAREAALRSQAARLGVADRVELTGWTDRVADQLHDMDVYCQPSRYETLGLALIEAMGAGLPCVASATGGVPELLDAGRCGRLVPAGDAAALAEAIGRLATDPAARQALGRQARERTLAAFTAERMAARYESLWAHVLAAPPARRLRPRPPKP